MGSNKHLMEVLVSELRAQGVIKGDKDQGANTKLTSRKAGRSKGMSFVHMDDSELQSSLSLAGHIDMQPGVTFKEYGQAKKMQTESSSDFIRISGGNFKLPVS